jgi:hypothetical protein
MTHAQKSDFIGGRRQFSRLLAAEVCASAVVMLDTPCSEVVWRVLATDSIRQFPLHFPSRASPCAITFQLESTTLAVSSRGTAPHTLNFEARCQPYTPAALPPATEPSISTLHDTLRSAHCIAQMPLRLSEVEPSFISTEHIQPASRSIYCVNYQQNTMCNGPTNALVCNKTLIQMSHTKIFKIIPGSDFKCFNLRHLN